MTVISAEARPKRSVRLAGNNDRFTQNFGHTRSIAAVPQGYLQRNGLFLLQGLALGIPVLCIVAPLWQVWHLHGQASQLRHQAGNQVFGPQLRPRRMLL